MRPAHRYGPEPEAGEKGSRAPNSKGDCRARREANARGPAGLAGKRTPVAGVNGNCGEQRRPFQQMAEGRPAWIGAGNSCSATGFARTVRFGAKPGRQDTVVE